MKPLFPFVLLATLCYAASVITVRMLAQRDSAQSMVFWFLAMVAVGAGLLAWPNWVPLRLADAWWLAGIAVFGTLGQVALTQLLQIGLLRTGRLCQSGRCGAERDAARREVAVVHQIGSEQRGADQAEDQGQQQCGAGRRAKGHW